MWAPKYQCGRVKLDQLGAHMAPGVLKLFATLDCNVQLKLPSFWCSIFLFHELRLIFKCLVFMFSVGMVTGICILVFGTMSVVNRQWIQNPDKNYLSFSFGLMVMSGFLVLFGGFCATFSATQYRFDRKKNQEKPRYGGHMIKPAMPNYWWSCRVPSTDIILT